MPRFYFHQYLNGRLAEDRRGQQFQTADEACAHAVRRTPVLLSKTVRCATGDTYLNTEVSDGKHTVFVVRGKVIVEKR